MNRSEISGLANGLFAEFRAKPGSREVASQFALGGLIAEIQQRKPTRILEFGPGIGTTTAAVVRTMERVCPAGGWQIIAVEPSAYCRDQLAQNVTTDRLAVFEVFDQIPADFGPFDLVVVDGPDDTRYIDLLGPRAVVFVENNRVDQRLALTTGTARTVVSVSRWPLWTLSRRGGYHVFQFEPTRLESARSASRGIVERLLAAGRPVARRVARVIGLGRVLDAADERASSAGAPLAAPRVDELDTQ